MATCSFTPFAGPTGGTVSVTATYTGSSADAPSAVSSALSVSVLGTNALSGFAITASANPVAAAKALTYTATLTGANGTPTGTVTFSDNGSAITCSGNTGAPDKVGSSGTALCNYTPATSGTHTITATYSGDANYAPASAPSYTEVVSGATAPTSVVLTSSANPSAYATSATLTATVTGSTTTPCGTVVFTATVSGTTTTICAAAAVTGSGTVSTATCAYDPSVTGGVGQTATINATYSGDATYTSKAATAYSQVMAGGNAPERLHPHLQPQPGRLGQGGDLHGHPERGQRHADRHGDLQRQRQPDRLLGQHHGPRQGLSSGAAICNYTPATVGHPHHHGGLLRRRQLRPGQSPPAP